MTENGQGVTSITSSGRQREHALSMRRFVFVREQDPDRPPREVGVITEGVRFSNGWVAMTWLGRRTSVVFYPNMGMAISIHAHGSRYTKIRWLDEDDPANASGDPEIAPVARRKKHFRMTMTASYISILATALIALAALAGFAVLIWWLWR